MRLNVSKLFRAYGLYNGIAAVTTFINGKLFQSSFELTGYITKISASLKVNPSCFKALSSLRVI